MRGLSTMTKKFNGGASRNVSSPYDESNSGANPLTASKPSGGQERATNAGL